MIDILSKDNLSKVLCRSQLNFEAVNATVREVVENVRQNGDTALIEYASRFDNTALTPETIAISEEEIERAYREVDAGLLGSLRRARDNILDYHRKQIPGDAILEQDGKSLGWMFRPVARAGIYVPGGTASYPSSVLMTALAARAANVGEIVMATPSREGKIHPLTLVAARECGVDEIYKVGGAQAIAALAFGTPHVKRADVIAGPGNIYVAMAKKEVYGYVGIDMIAGPSEILIVADGTAKCEYLAADMLSQAEHDALSTSILVVTDAALARAVAEELERQLNTLPRAEIARRAIEDNSAIVVTDSVEEALELANRVAPEHLELCFKGAESCLDRVRNAGAVFVGNYSPEPLGDYFAGPNHVLPTSGTARFFSVLSAATFLKRISVIRYDRDSLLAAADDVVALAEAEGLTAHANALRIREGLQ